MRIFDHIHGYIDICKSAKRIIDTPEFQRLRNVKQLGCVYSVFPSASHNRFEHSLGVYHLTRLYMNILNKDSRYFDKKQYELISVAALIHDIGHGPFSHLFDSYVTNTEHEYRSIEIFKNMNDIYGLGYTGVELDFIYKVIYPHNINDDKKYLYQIVSNKNGIDTDRFDYMLRDMKMTGIENRYDFDYNFVLQIMNNTIVSDRMFYKEQIKYLLEMFFQSRFIIYKKVCNHKTVKSIELMMGEVLQNLEPTFKINKSIKDSDWEKFCTFSDTIVHSLDFLGENLQENKDAFYLYNRIKSRDIYKLIEELVVYDEELCDKTISELNLKYNDPNNEYIINKSVIRYYSDEYPILVDENDSIVLENFFKNKGQDIYLIKVFQK